MDIVNVWTFRAPALHRRPSLGLVGQTVTPEASFSSWVILSSMGGWVS
jgi:hypothetical protein